MLMTKAYKLIGIILFLVAIANLCISFEITDLDEKISIIVSSIVTFIASILLYRGHRSWPILSFASSLLYCYLVARASTSMFLNGMFQAWWSALFFPVRDSSISWVSKISLVYFQGLLPLVFLALGIISLFAPILYRAASNGKLRV
jgi:hypothetical protein